MKRINFKSIIFGLLFAAIAGFFSAGLLAENTFTTLDRQFNNMPDSSGGDTTDTGGIITPGPGH